LSVELVVIIIIALAFDYLNGLHDSSNVVATVISSRAMMPRRALYMAAGADMAGALLVERSVASTVGDKVLARDAMTLKVIAAALAAAIGWNLITWFLGIPSSSSHALIGGIVGAGAASQGLSAVRASGLTKVLAALLLSPVLGLVVGYLFTRLALRVGKGLTPRANVWLKRLQWFTAFTLAFSHGTNDAQKTMGLITAALVAGGALQQFSVPLWVVFLSASAISLGTLTGGWRLIRTLGAKFYKIRPIHGFTAQASSGAVILGATAFGGPVSTTQVVSSAIVGAGSAERVSKVRWGVMKNIVMAWFLTIPAAAALGAVIYSVL
jgi:PiT family inorganic phosphate transporter